MDKFKLSPGVGRIYTISSEVYSDVTKRLSPYCKQHKNGKSHYAVCPECDNPIQIVGLYKPTIEARSKPYGRHNKGPITYLADYCEEDYLNCSYSNPQWKKPFQKRSHTSELAKRTKALVKSQFDRIVYILSRDIEIQISYSFAREMLKEYIADEGWLYKEATLNNLPWIFGLSNEAHRLYGRRIRQNGGLYEALIQNCSNLKLGDATEDGYVKVLNRDGAFLALNFFLYDYSRKVINEHLVETIKFQVADGYPPVSRVIYCKTIEIDTDYFLNLISKKDNSRRNIDYLKIADELIQL